MLEVYSWEPNANSGKPLLALREKGVEFVFHFVDMGRRAQHAPEYLKINPNGTVPTVVHDGLVMVESTPALEYIDETFEGPALRPSEPFLLWRMRRWMRFIDQHVAPALAMAGGSAAGQRMASQDAEEVAKAVAAIPLPERRQAWQLILSRGVPEAALAESDRRVSSAIREFEAALGEFPYLAGPAYTLADIVAIATVYALPLSRPAEIDPAQTPHLLAWLRRCHARPALRATFAAGSEWISGRCREMRRLLDIPE